MRCALGLLVLELFIFTANGLIADIQGGGCMLLGDPSFQGETCPEIIDSFYSGSGPGYTKFIQLQSGQCCLYNLRQNCDKVGSDLRLIVDQIIDSDCLQLFNVKQSSSKHGHSVNTTFFLVVGSIVLLSLLRIF